VVATCRDTTRCGHEGAEPRRQVRCPKEKTFARAPAEEKSPHTPHHHASPRAVREAVEAAEGKGAGEREGGRGKGALTVGSRELALGRLFQFVWPTNTTFSRVV